MKLSKHENYSSQNSQSNFLPIQNKIIKFEHIKIKIIQHPIIGYISVQPIKLFITKTQF